MFPLWTPSPFPPHVGPIELKSPFKVIKSNNPIKKHRPNTFFFSSRDFFFPTRDFFSSQDFFRVETFFESRLFFSSPDFSDSRLFSSRDFSDSRLFFPTRDFFYWVDKKSIDPIKKYSLKGNFIFIGLTWGGRGEKKKGGNLLLLDFSKKNKYQTRNI